MSARRDIKPLLDGFAAHLQRRHGTKIDVALMRDLRAFGAECYELGRHNAHRSSTIPAPLGEPDAAAGDATGQYSIHSRRGNGDR
jgi:hypothetical protein